ncbi:hypothetical protein ABN764_16150 [Paenibacillaceae sp. P-4]|uniref:hypothetical protein n=1 Tax=Paenibacillaceae bacterium P-4 TaxID=3160969 RepID=UPI0032E834F8
MNEADDALDLMTLIMALAIFTPIMIYCAVPLFQGHVGGFGVQIEKTALETESEIIPTARVMTTNDVLMMLVVADRYTPEPKKLRLNMMGTPREFAIDDVFLTNKELMLQEARSLLPLSTPVQLSLFAGPRSDPSGTGMRFWEVHR